MNEYDKETIERIKNILSPDEEVINRTKEIIKTYDDRSKLEYNKLVPILVSSIIIIFTISLVYVFLSADYLVVYANSEKRNQQKLKDQVVMEYEIRSQLAEVKYEQSGFEIYDFWMHMTGNSIESITYYSEQVNFAEIMYISYDQAMDSTFLEENNVIYSYAVDVNRDNNSMAVSDKGNTITLTMDELSNKDMGVISYTDNSNFCIDVSCKLSNGSVVEKKIQVSIESNKEQKQTVIIREINTSPKEDEL